MPFAIRFESPESFIPSPSRYARAELPAVPASIRNGCYRVSAIRRHLLNVRDDARAAEAATQRQRSPSIIEVVEFQAESRAAAAPFRH